MQKNYCWNDIKTSEITFLSEDEITSISGANNEPDWKKLRDWWWKNRRHIAWDVFKFTVKKKL